MNGLRKLAEKFPLLAWLSDRFAPHQRFISGDEFQIDHDDCGDERRRLWINVEKRLGWCYRCETSYDLFSLIRYVEGCSLAEAIRTVQEAVPRAASLDGIRRRVAALDALDEEPEADPPRRIELPLGFRACAEEPVWPPYLDRLGSRRLAVKHGVGWCENYGRYARRLIVPITYSGQVVSFAARLMRSRREGEEEWNPYLYPKSKPGVQAGTGSLLFNYDRAKSHRVIVLTEGTLDAIHIGDHSMSLLGKSLSREKLALLFASEAQEVVLMFDGDEAGRAATLKIGAMLRPFYTVRDARLPAGKDPDELSRATLREITARAPLLTADRTFRTRVKRGLGLEES